MTQDEFSALQRGDIVRGLVSNRTFLVTGNYGEHVTAVTSVDMTNPREWELVRRMNDREV